MATTHTTVRLPDELIAKVDQYAAEAVPGSTLNRSQALASLIVRGLDAWEERKAKRGKA